MKNFITKTYKLILLLPITFSGITMADVALEEITITAERRSESAQDVPISMTVMNGAKLQDLNMRGSGELGTQVPNLRTYNDSGENSSVQIVIRGVYSSGQTYMAGPSSSLYSDDLLLDSYISHGLAFFDVDQVEVLRGPQGTLFGRNSTAGAVQLVSKRPGDELEGYAELTYGNNSKTRLEGAVGGPVSDKVGVRISGFYDRQDGWLENIHNGEDIYDYDTYAIRAIVEYEPTENVDVLFKAQYGSLDQDPLLFQSTIPSPHAYSGMGIADAILNNPGPESGYSKANTDLSQSDLDNSVEDTQLNLTLNWGLSGMALTSVTGYSDVGFSFINDADSSGAPIFHQYNAVDYEGFIQELRLASETDSPLQWIVGGFYMDADMSSRVTDDLTGLYVLYGYDYPGTGFGDMDLIDHNSKSSAIFLQTNYSWTDKLKTTHGIRYSRDKLERVRTAGDFTTFPRTSNLSFLDYSAHEDGGSEVFVSDYRDDATTKEITWRLSADYAVTEDMLLYSSVSKGFKAGLLGFIYNSVEEEYVFVEPETVIAYEAGFKTQWLDNRMQLNAAAFYYDYSDYQTYTQIETDFMFTRSDINIPEVSFTGIEVELVAQATENLMVSFGLGMVDAKIEKYAPNAVDDLTGNKTPRTPDLDFNGLIRYDIPLAKGILSPQIDFNYVGDYYSQIENVQKIGDYWKANLRVNYQPYESGLKLSLFVQNVGDKKEIQQVYNANDAYGLGTDLTTFDPPRTYGVTARYDF